LVVKIDIDLEEGVLVIGTSSGGLSNNSVLHGIQGVLGGIQKSLIEVPEIIPLDLLGFLSMDVLLILNDMGIEFVEHDGVDKIVDGSLDFLILRHKEVGVLGNMIFLSLDELFQRHWLGVIGKVDKKDLGDLLEVVLNTVLDDVIDGDDQLVEFVKALMNVFKITVNVHGSPGKSNHSRPEL
jgi:hypothetical protein